jgi:hypothetical protein
MSVEAQTEITIDRPLKAVAAYAANLENVQHWYHGVTSASWQTPPPAKKGSQVALVNRLLGKRFPYVLEIVDYDVPRRVVMRSTEGTKMITTYSWAAAGPKATRMTLHRRGECSPFNIMATIVWKLGMRKRLERDLATLKAVLERT